MYGIGLRVSVLVMNTAWSLKIVWKLFKDDKINSRITNLKDTVPSSLRSRTSGSEQKYASWLCASFVDCWARTFWTSDNYRVRLLTTALHRTLIDQSFSDLLTNTNVLSSYINNNYYSDLSRHFFEKGDWGHFIKFWMMDCRFVGFVVPNVVRSLRKIVADSTKPVF